jgi:hypothetical protein
MSYPKINKEEDIMPKKRRVTVLKPKRFSDLTMTKDLATGL